MPTLSNKRHEEYCFALASGLNKTEAARRAGFADTASAANRGSRLWKRKDVQRRVQELQELHCTNDGPIGSKQWTVLELVQTHRLARLENQHSVSVQALLAIAKINGHVVDHKLSYSERVNIHTLRSPQLAELLARDGRLLPEAQRSELLEADPELADVLDTPVQGVQSPQPRDSSSSD